MRKQLLYLGLIGGSAVFSIPLRPGEVLPRLPAGGLRSLEDVAALPGAKPFSVTVVFPGPSPSLYAYPTQTAQRNIYRVAVP